MTPAPTFPSPSPRCRCWKPTAPGHDIDCPAGRREPLWPWQRHLVDLVMSGKPVVLMTPRR